MPANPSNCYEIDIEDVEYPRYGGGKLGQSVSARRF
jgi:hypothetical protein